MAKSTFKATNIGFTVGSKLFAAAFAFFSHFKGHGRPIVVRLEYKVNQMPVICTAGILPAEFEPTAKFKTRNKIFINNGGGHACKNVLEIDMPA
jgi:hypothetical protein